MKTEKQPIRRRTHPTSGVTALQFVADHKKKRARLLRKASTLAEKILWEKLRNRQIDGLKFRRQQVIEGFIVDFFCEEGKLVLEVDGSIHNEEIQQRRDDHREKVFKARGLHVLRFKNEEVLHRMKYCTDLISLTVRERGVVA